MGGVEHMISSANVNMTVRASSLCKTVPPYNSQFAGGGRLATAMLYLSEVESGGFTIFPKLGLFVAPEAGSLLLWSIRKSDGETDTRMSHLGCPVLYGDKWIGTKWIRWEAQMDKFKCFLPRGKNFLPNNVIR